MNKNTLLAFVLIMATMAFFMSPTYEKMVKKISGQKETPSDSTASELFQDTLNRKKTDSSNAMAATSGQKTRGKTEERDSSIAKQDTAETSGDTIWIETDKLIAGITDVGARIVSLKMKEYRIDHTKGITSPGDSNGYVDLIPQGSEGGCGMTINTISFDNRKFIIENASLDKNVKIKGTDKKEVSFLYRDSSGTKEIRKVFTFSGDSYKIGMGLKSEQLNNNRLSISWLGGIHESEQNKIGMYQTEERKVHYSDGKFVGHIKATKIPPTDYENPESGNNRWIGVSSKYFFIALVADTTKDADLKVIAFEDVKKEQKDGKKDKLKRINYSFIFQYTTEGNSASFWLYTGPSKYEVLKKAHMEFEQILFPVLSWARYIFWSDKWFPPLAEFVLWLLLLLYNIVKDYGVAIIILTVLSKVVTYPLTQSSMKSMNRMKDLQPKINVLRQKHKNNPKKMNEEIMALYKAEGVNPLNPGCLPMFLQMPIFMSLYVVFQRAIELRGAGTVLLPWVHDLSKPEIIFTIPGGGIPLYGSNFAILPIIMGILTYFQNKMTIKDPNQKMMIYFMPIFMLALFNSFPSGLVLYWTMSSGIQLLQQFYTENKKKKEMVAAAVSSVSRPTIRKK